MNLLGSNTRYGIPGNTEMAKSNRNNYKKENWIEANFGEEISLKIGKNIEISNLVLFRKHLLLKIKFSYLCPPQKGVVSSWF